MCSAPAPRLFVDEKEYVAQEKDFCANPLIASRYISEILRAEPEGLVWARRGRNDFGEGLLEARQRGIIRAVQILENYDSFPWRPRRLAEEVENDLESGVSGLDS